MYCLRSFWAASSLGLDSSATGSPIRCPHLWQNWASVGSSVPHSGQDATIGEPHELQNLASAGFSAWHLGQFNAVSFRRAY